MAIRSPECTLIAPVGGFTSQIRTSGELFRTFAKPRIVGKKVIVLLTACSDPLFQSGPVGGYPIRCPIREVVRLIRIFADVVQLGPTRVHFKEILAARVIESKPPQRIVGKEERHPPPRIKQ